jgi:multidrug resistance efflux pump
MTAEARPTPRVRPRSPSEAKARQRQWWHYAIVTAALFALGGLGWGGHSLWFSVTHVRATYARVSGYVVNVSAKGDTRVRKVLVQTGDTVRRGQEVALLDNADLQAAADQAKATLTARRSELARAKADLDMTISQAAAAEAQAQAELNAAQARLAQAEAEARMQQQQQPDEVRRASAQLSQAKADLARLKAGPRPQEIAQARADLVAAQAQFNKATTTLSRMEKLEGSGAISAEQLDAARTDKQVADTAVTSARERLSLMEAGSRSEDVERAQAAVLAAEAALEVAKANALQGQMKEQQVAARTAEKEQATAAVFAAQASGRSTTLRQQDVLAAQAAVTEAEAALQGAQVRLSEAALRSPVSGVVVRGPGESVHDGEVVAKGAPIVTVVSTEGALWISGAVSELYADRVHEGQPISIRIEAFPRKWFQGKVTQVGGATQFTAGSAESPWMIQQVPIKASFDPAGAHVKPGLSCRLWIDVRKR